MLSDGSENAVVVMQAYYAERVPDPVVRDGPLTRIWQPIGRPAERPRALTELPARSDLPAADPRLALGRRWRHDQPDFRERLSPLARPVTAYADVERVTDRGLRSSAIDGSMDDREEDFEEEPWR